MDTPKIDSPARMDAFVSKLVEMLDAETSLGDDIHAGAALMSTLCTAAVRLAMGGADMKAVLAGFNEAVADGYRRIGSGETRQ